MGVGKVFDKTTIQKKNSLQIKNRHPNSLPSHNFHLFLQGLHGEFLWSPSQCIIHNTPDVAEVPHSVLRHNLVTQPYTETNIEDSARSCSMCHHPQCNTVNLFAHSV